MKYQLYRTQQLNCDLETAWAFFSSPQNLSDITPKNMNFIVHTDTSKKEIFEGMNSDCKSDKKVKRKIISSQDLFIEYQSYYARPFYIPESWSVEYRIWKAEDKYNTVK